MTAQRHIETQEGSAFEASLDRRLGERFEVEALVGSGGMGLVFRCRDLLDGSTVAVKVLQHPEYIAIERFTREAEVLAGLVHPGIVRYVAHGRTPRGEPFLAMEWLDGETLADCIARGPISGTATARLGAKVLQALALAHSRGIVHRDIKPSNLFLPGADLDQVKLLDFGIAQREHDLWQITQPGTAVGTPLYMAPEQYRESGNVDGRADVFSLACVLFECATGGAPQLTVDRDQGAFAWEEGTLRTLHEGLPPPLRSVLGRMLALARDERPGDPEKLAPELRHAALALAGTESQPVRPSRARTLSGDEQRMTAVVVISGISGAGEDAATLASLAATLRARGAKLDRTSEGRWIVALVGRGVPGDIAAHAARLALRVQATFPGARVAIATGRISEDEAALAGAVEKASRLLPAAPADTVCVDDRSARLLEGRFELEPLAQGTFRLRFERDMREVPQTLMGKEVPCFGRERKISFLENLWQDVCEGGSACALVLTAPAGGGKSRVRHEFCRRIEGGRPFQLLLGRGDPMHDGAPFALLGPSLLAAAGISGEEPEPLQRERLAARVTRVLPGEPGRRAAAFLGEIANLPFPDHYLPGLRAARKDARVMADQRLMAWLDWLEAECERQPVLLVLEDLHWADAPSISFVDAALRVLARKPFMVLALARPEVERRFPNLWAARNPQRISLSPLSLRSSQRMVEHVAGKLPEASVRWIVDRAQGSPFFLQELLRVVAEGGQVGDDRNLPDTVLGMVQARLDGFGPEAKLVLRAGAVFGESFRAGGVKALLDPEQRNDVDKWLDILEEQEVVFGRRGSERRDYAFRHALFRQAAYELLPPEEKRLGHLLAGRFLADSGERDGRVLADHFERAGDNASAVTWWVVAAQQALDANELGDALARVEKAVRLGAAGEELFSLKLTEARALCWKGDYPESETAARVALGTKQDRLRLLAMTALLDALGPQAKYAEISDEQRGLARPSEPELDSLWLGAMETAAVYLSIGVDHTHYEQILALLGHEREHLDPLLAGRYESLKAQAARNKGLLSEAIRHLQRAADHYQGIGLQLDSCIASGNLANALSELGQLEKAVERLRSILGLARKMDLKHLLGGCLQMLTNILAYQGSFDEARAFGLEGRAVTRAQNDRRFQGFAEAYLSVTEYLAGNFAAAESYACDAMATWEAVPLARPFAVALLARTLVAQGRAAEALSHARDAYAQLEKMGGVDDGEATIRLALAECLLATGDREAAATAVASAAQWLRARADKIDDPAYRESFLTRIPEHRRIQDLARDFGV